MKVSTLFILLMITLNVGVWANALSKYDFVKKPVDINTPATDSDLYGLLVDVCVNGECGKYMVDKDFTLSDCKEEAAARHLDDTPIVKWECVVLDVE